MLYYPPEKMQINEILKQLGLKDKEPEVFIALLQLSGFQPASTIASKSDINRTTTYKTLVKLSKMGLISKNIQYGTTYFAIEHPELVLEKAINKEKSKIENLHKNFLEALPQLQKLKKEETVIPKVRYYEGIEGVKKVYEDTLSSTEPIYAFEDFDDFPSEFRQWLYQEYMPKRIKRKIFAYVLTPESPENENYRRKDTLSLKETRFVKTEHFPIETEINIYGNKVAFFSYKEKEAFASIIESKTISNSMKSIFQINWNQAQ